MLPTGVARTEVADGLGSPWEHEGGVRVVGDLGSWRAEVRRDEGKVGGGEAGL